MSQVSWVVMGDFNEILCQEEMFGKRRRERTQMERFREALVACDLHDVGMEGAKFT